MGIISLVIPQIGQPDTTEDVKVQNAFTTIQTAINGNLDSTNLSAATSQSAGVNASGQTVKGASIIATSESRTNVAYGLMPTPDQVTGIVLPANGLIAVWYQALLQESAADNARAAIFLGANQLKVQQSVAGTAGPGTQAAYTGNGSTANINHPLFSCTAGLACATMTGSGASADVTTGQAVGGLSGVSTAMEVGGSATSSFPALGGPCYIVAAAGTYTVSVQFKAISGSVTVSSRKLLVEALSFA